MTRSRPPWRYAYHRQEPRRWFAGLSGVLASIGLHGWVAVTLAAITVTILRYGMENLPVAQRPELQGPYERPVFFRPEHFLDGTGQDDSASQARTGDTGKAWVSTLPDPSDLARGYEECVANSDLGAAEAFMAVGPSRADAGMFGSRIQQTAQQNAEPQPGVRTFERENTLRIALAWIAAQQEADGSWRATPGRSSTGMTALALISLVRSSDGATYRFWSASESAATHLDSQRETGRDDQAFITWALRCERATLTYRTNEHFPTAAARLVKQQETSGGWRTSRQHAGISDARTTAWSLLALVEASDDDPAISEARTRLSTALAAMQKRQPNTDRPAFPSAWDATSGTGSTDGDDPLWGAFLLVLLDQAEFQVWRTTLVAETLRRADDDLLAADPERLLVHALIRIHTHALDLRTWLWRIEQRLDRQIHRHGSDRGSWDPPAGGDRLEFTVWNALILHEIYLADAPFTASTIPTTP